MKKNLLLSVAFSVVCLFISCDTKKSSISGKVVKKTTGMPIYNALITFTQCKKDGDNCDEEIIGQAYTNENGEFVITKKTGSASRTKWIVVRKDDKKIAQVDNVGLNDKDILIEAL